MTKDELGGVKVHAEISEQLILSQRMMMIVLKWLEIWSVFTVTLEGKAPQKQYMASGNEVREELNSSSRYRISHMICMRLCRVVDDGYL